VVDRLVRQSGRIDVQVVMGDEAGPGSRQAAAPRQTPRTPRDYLESILVPVLITAAALLLQQRALATIDAAMLYLLGVVFVSSRHARGPSLVTSLLSIAFFDFFFVPPYFTFSVSDVRFVLTFGVMLAVALVMGTLTGRVRVRRCPPASGSGAPPLYAFSRDLAPRDSPRPGP
jgi:two-component system sensor histidine kinase KdpD